jgi:hypothetical protein
VNTSSWTKMSLKSTIEDHLEEFKDEINGDSYDRLDALFDYFTTGKISCSR